MIWLQGAQITVESIQNLNFKFDMSFFFRQITQIIVILKDRNGKQFTSFLFVMIWLQGAHSRVHSKFEFQVRYFFPFRKRKKLVKLHRLSSCNGFLTDVGSTLCWLFNNALYLVESQLNSFKGSLEYFKAEKVKYWPNLPELLIGNICQYQTQSIKH